ncbi:MAG: UPF0175 family protein [Thermoplasmata archaeon]
MDTVKAKIELPRSILNICRTDEKGLTETVTKTFIIELYREGIISLGKAAEILGYTKTEMMAVLRDRNIPLNYDNEELEKDRETWKRLE